MRRGRRRQQRRRPEQDPLGCAGRARRRDDDDGRVVLVVLALEQGLAGAERRGRGPVRGVGQDGVARAVERGAEGGQEGRQEARTGFDGDRPQAASGGGGGVGHGLQPDGSSLTWRAGAPSPGREMAGCRRVVRGGGPGSDRAARARPRRERPHGLGNAHRGGRPRVRHPVARPAVLLGSPRPLGSGRRRPLPRRAGPRGPARRHGDGAVRPHRPQRHDHGRSSRPRTPAWTAAAASPARPRSGPGSTRPAPSCSPGAPSWSRPRRSALEAVADRLEMAIAAGS